MTTTHRILALGALLVIAACDQASAPPAAAGSAPAAPGAAMGTSARPEAPPPPPPQTQPAPTAAPDHPSNGPVTPNATLDSSSVQAVLRSRMSEVKRTCWETDAGSALSSANVRLTLTIGADGHVQNASVTGDEPVASCIAQEARGWTFAAPDTATTVNIPFRFVRQ